MQLVCEPAKIMKLKYLQIAYHRNGVGGNGFHIVIFDDDGETKQAIVFPEHGNIAIICQSNPAIQAHRGDKYENRIRAAIQRYGREGKLIYATSSLAA